MTPPRVEVMQPEQLRARRAELLAQARIPEAELRRRSEEYTLPPELVVVVDELDELDFLLGA